MHWSHVVIRDSSFTKHFKKVIQGTNLLLLLQIEVLDDLKHKLLYGEHHYFFLILIMAVKLQFIQGKQQGLIAVWSSAKTIAHWLICKQLIHSFESCLEDIWWHLHALYILLQNVEELNYFLTLLIFSFNKHVCINLSQSIAHYASLFRHLLNIVEVHRYKTHKGFNFR